jgi:hypothetical protein
MNNPVAKLHIDKDAGSYLIFSGKYRDAIFSHDMINYPNSQGHKEQDPIQEYRLNSCGYRGPEFKNNVDLLFSGCSFTYGMGIPEDGIWGTIIANRLNLEYNNLSQNGASIPWMVRQLFAYFKKYGNPKKLVCLFPTLTRSFFASNSEILTTEDNFIEESTKDLDGKKSIYNVELSNLPNPEKRKRYSKRPHILDDVVNLDSVVQVAMQNIRMLEQYCDSSGIEFLWGSWCQAFNLIINDGGLSKLYDFSHYVDVKNELWNNTRNVSPKDIFYQTESEKMNCYENHKINGCECHVSCHQEFFNKYQDSFYLGTDTLQGVPHFGVHRNVHIAESFIEKLGKRL